MCFPFFSFPFLIQVGNKSRETASVAVGGGRKKKMGEEDQEKGERHRDASADQKLGRGKNKTESSKRMNLDALPDLPEEVTEVCRMSMLLIPWGQRGKSLKTCHSRASSRHAMTSVINAVLKKSILILSNGSKNIFETKSRQNIFQYKSSPEGSNLYISVVASSTHFSVFFIAKQKRISKDLYVVVRIFDIRSLGPRAT